MAFTAFLFLLVFFLSIFKTVHSGAGAFCYDEESSCDVHHWGGECATGKRQSPIDIPVPDPKKIPKKITKNLVLNKRYCSAQDFKMKNNGHTLSTSIRADMTSTSFASGTLLGGSYVFSQMHFHWGLNDTEGSEHTLGGKRFPLEGHLVHYLSKYHSLSDAVKSNKKGALAVLGMFYELQEKDNPALSPIIDHYLELLDEEMNTTGNSLTLDQILPHEKENLVIQYDGSLTTPSCNEIVNWNVFLHPVGISKKQLDEFHSLHSHYGKGMWNYRPTQPINSRPVKVHLVKTQCQADKPKGGDKDKAGDKSKGGDKDKALDKPKGGEKDKAVDKAKAH